MLTAAVLNEVGLAPTRPPAVAIASDEMLAERVGRGESPPLLRIWENDRALVVPKWRLQGQRVKSIVDRHGQEWPICPRGSGGTAVVHGPGTLNVSLILPLRARHQPSIVDAYKSWLALFGAALGDAYDIAVDAASIQGAFCTGSYDVVADGRKLAGVAQARRRGGVVVHGTVLVNVDRQDYMSLVAIGERLLGMCDNGTVYDPKRIVSLHELLGRPVSTYEVADALKRTAVDAEGQKESA